MPDRPERARTPADRASAGPAPSRPPTHAARSGTLPRTGPRRVQRSLLSRAERRLLLGLARRLPAGVTPDRLTLLALLGAVLTGAATLAAGSHLAWLHAASLGLAVHWFGDSLDGTLARVRNIRRERYGYFVDHQADAAAAVLILGALGLSPLARLDLALALLGGYLLMMSLTHAVALTRGRFRLAYSGVGPTEVRLVLIAANTAVWALGNPVLSLGPLQGTIYDAVCAVGAVLLTGTWLVATLQTTRTLARLDPPR